MEGKGRESAMKLALVGYGKMGRAVENVAMERGHEVVARIDPTLDTHDLRAETLGGANVAIEFTVPAAAVDNITALAAAGVDTVVGTTGWHQRLDEATEAVVDAGTGLVHASNFSLGVSLFLRLARTAAKMADALGEFPNSFDELYRAVEGVQRLLPMFLPAVKIPDRQNRIEHRTVEFVGFLVGGDCRGVVLHLLVGRREVEIRRS